MADLGLRVVLDFDETNIDAATQLMQAKQAGAILEVAAVPIVKQLESNAVSEGTERKSRWAKA
jgi:hypothetical protein